MPFDGFYHRVFTNSNLAFYTYASIAVRNSFVSLLMCLFWLTILLYRGYRVALTIFRAVELKFLFILWPQVSLDKLRKIGFCLVCFLVVFTFRLKARQWGRFSIKGALEKAQWLKRLCSYCSDFDQAMKLDTL